jgi:hypothetical protein
MSPLICHVGLMLVISLLLWLGLRLRMAQREISTLKHVTHDLSGKYQAFEQRHVEVLKALRFKAEGLEIHQEIQALSSCLEREEALLRSVARDVT